ncbi:MAG TPA: recombination protein NinG [Chryseosolibacter sp.]|nr:recombination protein NinG [Chryseosolibacter sp.]
MSYFGFKKRPAKTSDYSKLLGKLDYAFSEVVRLTAADEKEGMCICITCGDKQHWTDMECGHYVKRRHLATRYDLQNCGAQCSTCNCVNDGREDEHERYIDRTYGEGTAAKLKRKAQSEPKFTERELLGMLDELRKEIKALREEKFS